MSKHMKWIKLTRELFGTSLVVTKAIHDLLITLGQYDSRRPEAVNKGGAS